MPHNLNDKLVILETEINSNLENVQKDEYMRILELNTNLQNEIEE